jgi:hypothetical protein
MHNIVTAGGSSPTQANYVAAAATPDGMLLIAYIPPAHSGPITIDMTTLAAPSRARWFNPATAAYSLNDQSLPNTGTRVFNSPGNNGSGFSDWVLVIDVVAADIANVP